MLVATFVLIVFKKLIRILPLASCALGLLMGLLLGPATAVELFDGRTVLVMVDDAGCVYCAKWDREVSASYDASPEGHFAPLERHRIGSRALAGLGRLVYTPTFILIVRGQETGRITGYGGADFFWAEIDRLYGKAGFRPDTDPLLPQEDRASLAAPRLISAP
jgi:hypothetical protein